MPLRIAINGYGRIGRQIVRAIYEYQLHQEIEVVAINALGSLEVNAHLTQYDSTHGRFNAQVSYDDTHLIINNDKIRVFSAHNPEELDWDSVGVDLVMECTGVFTSKEKAQIHLKNGAKKVLISAPGADDVDATIVYGINHNTITPDMTIVSNASCTTNCLAPVAQALNQELGIIKGLMTTIHAFTNDQVLTDVRHNDLRRARSATCNLIPTKTGAAKAIGLVIPELKGKLDGFAVRVPTINVSMVDLTFEASRATSIEEVNTIIQKASETYLNGVLAYNTIPLVSGDFNHYPIASVFDATLTKVSNQTLVKVLAWYDNEWGFSCQMLNTARALFNMPVTPIQP